jgi:hypothetical protein
MTTDENSRSSFISDQKILLPPGLVVNLVVAQAWTHQKSWIYSTIHNPQSTAHSKLVTIEWESVTLQSVISLADSSMKERKNQMQTETSL